ncbi:DNA-binding CsgD family transcriptional regulator [Crossiella equi]|uniref:DNA-binding CsgD family transcriptional regulator n=1 Tax=Crossiella equi TaxID=130796 RepID=A0ABS5ASB9_9PSEU|nr:LuxR family transcriptional regulator [Crossiella equi]MBP2479463.1 DNA-binding CsgD family transcriptional regulator [Crossiella equi]
MVELVGRAVECKVLADLLDAVRDGRGTALVLAGEPGMGKTALLRHLTGEAEDLLVLSVAGVRTERELAFAALHRLIAPLPPQADLLPPPQRAAVRAVFGLADGPAGDRFLVALGITGLLAELARTRPVLVVVDDEQWLDRATLRVLTFAARRLAAERVGLVFASRAPSAELESLPVHTVPGLPARESGQLLDSALAGCLDPEVRARLLTEARGNPLALLALPRRVTPAGLAGGFALPGVLPVAQRVESAYRRRLAKVSPEVRQWLVIAAADPVGDPGTLWAAAGHAGLRAEAATGAAETGLVRVDTSVAFRHPLARSAVYLAADPAQRRAAHRALAAAADPVTDPDRRAWHRAQGTTVPEEDVAAELTRAAERARARGGPAAAAAFLERAAALTPDRADRAPRLLAAAEALRDCGGLLPALALLDLADQVPGQDPHHARVTHLRGQITLRLHRRVEAVGHLLDAAGLFLTRDPARADEVYAEALCAAVWDDGLDCLDPRAVALAVPAEAGRSTRGLVLTGLRLRVLSGHHAAAPMLRRGLDQVLARHRAEDVWPGTCGPLVNVAVDLWDSRAWHLFTRRQVSASREAGALADLPVALAHLAANQVFEGELAAAEASLAEARSVVEATGGAPNADTLLLVAAWRGDGERTAPLAAAVRARFADGLSSAPLFADYADAVLANARGRFAEAFEKLWGQFSRDRFALGPLLVPEIADAASRSGANAALREVAGWLAEREQVTRGDWLSGVAERVRALLDTEAAEQHYRASIALLTRTPVRLELARSHLAYGEWLRRQRRRGDARVQLRTARELFSEMGAAGFADRATRELRATGEATERAEDPDTIPLTAQEAQIAALAKEGLSNPEIAARLFISKRTVQYHLRKVFQKLKITSRAQLDRALAS